MKCNTVQRALGSLVTGENSHYFPCPAIHHTGSVLPRQLLFSKAGLHTETKKFSIYVLPGGRTLTRQIELEEEIQK